MLENGGCRTFYPMKSNMDYAAQQIRQYSETAARRQKMGLQGDGADPDSFAAKLKKADEFIASGESCGATDSVGIILRQMREPEAGEKVSKTVFHNGVCVVVEKDYMRGNSITVAGSSCWNPMSFLVQAPKGLVENTIAINTPYIKFTCPTILLLFSIMITITITDMLSIIYHCVLVLI